MAGITPISNVPQFSLSGWKGSTLPTGYNNSMDIYEELVQMTDYLNQMGLLVNDVANQWNQITTWITEDGLNEMVIAELNKWVQDGTFTKILEDTALTDITTKLNGEIATRASEDIRIQNALQANIDNVVKDMNNNVATIKNNLQGQIDTTNASLNGNVTNLKNEIDANDLKQSQNANALKGQFQNEIDHMANGAPVAAYDTLKELQSVFPNGASGAYLVNEDGYIYFWRDNNWKRAVKYTSDTQTATDLASSNAIVYVDSPINVTYLGDDNKIKFPSGRVIIGGKEYPFTAQDLQWQENNFIFFDRANANFNIGVPNATTTFIGATYRNPDNLPYLQINANAVIYNGSNGDRTARLADVFNNGLNFIVTDNNVPVSISLDGQTIKFPKGHVTCGSFTYEYPEQTISNPTNGYLMFNRVYLTFSIGGTEKDGWKVCVGTLLNDALHTNASPLINLFGNTHAIIAGGGEDDELDFKPTTTTELMSASTAMIYPVDSKITFNTVNQTITFPETHVLISGHEFDTPAQTLTSVGNGWIVYDKSTKRFSIGAPTDKNWFIVTVGFAQYASDSKPTGLYLQCPENSIEYITSGGNADDTGLNFAVLADSFAQHIKVDKDYVDYLAQYLTKHGYSVNTVRNAIGGTQLVQRTGRTDSFCERIESFKGTNQDFIIIQGGTNDWGNSNPIGTMGDTNPSSLYGAMDYLINKANKDFPEIQIYFALPIDRNDNDSTDSGTKNSVGFTLDDYISAMKEVCNKYNVPYIDLQKETGIYPWKNGTATLIDRLHPTELGHQRIARAIVSHIGY